MQARLLNSPTLSKYERIRIIGQGLTGSLLALNLHEMGIPFVVQDIDMPGCATAVAPGIVNPLAGRNFRPPEYVDELLEQLHKSMDLVKNKLGIQIWNTCPILRMFSEPTQLDRFKKTQRESQTQGFVETEFPENTFENLNDIYGSFLTRKGGWADLPLFMEKTRSWLKQEGLLVEEEWLATNQSPKTQNPEEIVVFCEGWHVTNNPHWSFIPHNPAKGEMILVRFEDELPRDRIYNQSCWVQPVTNNLWRVGATYSWDSFDGMASLEGATQLQDSLHLLTPIPFHVEDQMAGVRPIVDDYKPVIGQHPEIENWYILNALGSKGVLQAPTAVKDLIDNLVEGSRIPANWSVDRFK